jgi:hypothetical protein
MTGLAMASKYPKYSRLDEATILQPYVCKEDFKPPRVWMKVWCPRKSSALR